MDQKSPKKRKRMLPKNAKDLPVRDLMERIFGKRAMKELDKIVAERSTDKNSGEKVEL